MKIIKFSTNGCSLCRKLESMLDKLDLKADEELVMYPDSGETPKVEIMSFPTLVKFDDNYNELDRIVGLVPASRLRQFFEVE